MQRAAGEGCTGPATASTSSQTPEAPPARRKGQWILHGPLSISSFTVSHTHDAHGPHLLDGQTSNTRTSTSLRSAAMGLHTAGKCDECWRRPASSVVTSYRHSRSGGKVGVWTSFAMSNEGRRASLAPPRRESPRGTPDFIPLVPPVWSLDTWLDALSEQSGSDGDCCPSGEGSDESLSLRPRWRRVFTAPKSSYQRKKVGWDQS